MQRRANRDPENSDSTMATSCVKPSTLHATYSRAASRLSRTLFFSACDTGHPSLAVSAAFWKPATSKPGTRPRTDRALDMTRNPPSIRSKVTAALTRSRSAGVPDVANPCDKAIAKQQACAAASSSSGLVLPPGSSSVREAHVTGSSVNRLLLPAETVPLPFMRSPSHTAEARRIAAIFLSPSVFPTNLPLASADRKHARGGSLSLRPRPGITISR